MSKLCGIPCAADRRSGGVRSQAPVMEHTTFFEHYRICTKDDGSPEEVSRTGAAINYKAVDTRSNEPVTVQLIPVATVDQTKREQFEERVRTAQKLDHINIAKVFASGVEHDHFALISEYLEGETADSWVVAHGPMPADAALRAGLQVVRAVGAAAFFNLTHRAIQPSNLMMVPGQSPDGGWPFVKLLNFGLAGLELHSGSGEARELAPATSPQFASPQQLFGGEIGFPSEMYSLGATMCFLLTGAVPLAVSQTNAPSRLRRLPELSRMPKALRNLLVRMLRQKPEDRPQDPVAFEQEMRECLTKVERQQAFRLKLGIPLAATLPKKTKPKEPAGPLAQVFRGVVAVAVLLLAAAAAAELFFPDKIPFLHPAGQIGVPIGVPNAQSFASAPVQTAAASAAPTIVRKSTTPSPSITMADENQQVTPPIQQTPAANTQPSGGKSPTTEDNQIAAVSPVTEPPPPAAGPEEPPSVNENSEQGQSTESSEPAASSKNKVTESNPTSIPRRPRVTHSVPREEQYGRGPIHQSQMRSRVIGMTPDGRMILRLRSGRVIIVTPRYDDDVVTPNPRRRPYVPPYQPFYPPGYPFND